MTFKYSIAGSHVSITFSAKPDERIRSMLKANGFRWSPANSFWWRPRVSGAADFLAALERALNAPNAPTHERWGNAPRA
ncbi:MAG TPA: hypothetical protein VFE62_18150 [Gemmataceae bacterium]|nr:hypothetical protein [Gemmataceae bacterium]